MRSRIRILMRVKSWIQIHIKVKIQKLALKACRLTMVHWWFYHSDEEQDPDSQLK
jgi:hypothetical protein